MQMKCSFQHFSAQYEFGLVIENVMRVKDGNFKKSWLTNCAKMRILKMGVPLYKLASCIYCYTFCLCLYCLGYMTRLAILRCKKDSHVILFLKKINKMQVAS